jgi:DNA mismatch repair protein MutL
MPAGTVFEVRDLFYNLPARRKFLRKTATEFGHVAESVMRLSLAHPHIQFQLIHNERMVFNYYRQEHAFERIGEALGRSVAGALRRIECKRGELSLSGYVATPDQSRSSTQAMYTYINGRFIRDPVVKHAVLDAYRQLLMKGRYPVCVLFLRMPPDRVDVNVHPTKHEVRFHDQRLVHDFVTHAIRQELRSSMETHNPEGEPGSRENGSSGSDLRKTAVFPDQGRAQINTVEQHRGDIASASVKLSKTDDSGFRTDYRAEAQAGSAIAEPDSVWSRVENSARQYSQCAGNLPDTEPEVEKQSSYLLNSPAEGGYFASLRIVGQYARSYLVCEDGDDMILIDQHAAHERIGFERLRAQYTRTAIERQELLFPQMLELTQAQDTQMREHVEYFARLGFELDPFGGTTWALKALPILLEEHDIATLILDILADLTRWGTAQAGREAVDEVLIKMACHSMVRANETLDMREMRALLVQLDEVDFNRHCPHGRPVLHRLQRREIEKMFART